MNTEWYLNNLRFRTLEKANEWQLLALNIGVAYNDAYQEQQQALDGIKKQIEEVKRREAARMAFALSLVTGGIVGPISNELAKKLTVVGEKATLKGLTEIISKDSLLTEWTVHAFKELTKLGSDKALEFGMDKLNLSIPEVHQGAFEPVGMTPFEYAQTLEAGIKARAVVMSDLASALYSGLANVPPDIARNTYDSFLASSFFRLPSPVPDRDILKKRALLMLWIAWARLRDERYWKTQKALIGVVDSAEVYSWTPLVKILQGLGAPTAQFTIRNP